MSIIKDMAYRIVQGDVKRTIMEAYRRGEQAGIQSGYMEGRKSVLNSAKGGVILGVNQRVSRELDDLGTENVTMWGCEQLQMILNYRYENELNTVITTNRPLDDLFYASAYKGDNWRHDAGMRIASRLQRESWTAVVVVEGQPHMMR